MVMAGTGEITCLRRLRYAYGAYTQSSFHPSWKYGIHVATHMALGLLFVGGGRMTLGTSDAAIACMVTAFFPRFHHVSSDNKSFLQALRHLWVMAIEPRCIVARDVRTKEVVFLPLKISLKEEGWSQMVCPTLIPDLDQILSIRVDTPRYWPFHLDMERIPRHKLNLLRSQTLFVKRRTAFLGYTEDPRGSRSLFVRSRSAGGEAATLDYPHLLSEDLQLHNSGDLSEFIKSFSNHPLFLAFADRFARDDGETEEERLFQKYCYAALFDCILSDKPQSLQTHLTLWRYRMMQEDERDFHLRLVDLKCLVDFYSKIYDRRFSGKLENNYRPPLLRESTVSGAMHTLDERLDKLRKSEDFYKILEAYAMGRVVPEGAGPHLAWYLLRNSVPISTLLYVLKGLVKDAYDKSKMQGEDGANMRAGVREVLHATGARMTSALGGSWSVRSLDEILDIWTSNNFVSNPEQHT
jgi:anaphase-promoting complex subunit 1